MVRISAKLERQPAGTHFHDPASYVSLAHVGWRDDDGLATASLRAVVVAFYLPQFHAIPENDEWWGAGFTEWTNVRRALPRFEGHSQPQMPGELGQYDLLDPYVMRKQVDMARAHGIGAFCFYYYWFSGRKVLERPVDRYLADTSLGLPFCLCWANEPWTRRWDGREDDVLLAQAHGAEDDHAFIESMLPFFRDPRYLKVQGKPVLLLYRAELLPNAKATSERWRTRCREAGIGEIHLACVESFRRTDPRAHGFDAAVEFPPNLADAATMRVSVTAASPDYAGEVLDWRKMQAQFRARPAAPYRLHRGVNVAWDNEARRPGRGRTYIHSSPRRYEDWLRATIDQSISHENHGERPLVFVNAWNEWAEGAHLEPDARLGYAWLQATRRALVTPRVPPSRPCVVLHVHHLEVAEEILAVLQSAAIEHRLLLTTSSVLASPLRRVLESMGLSGTIHVFENRGRDILPFLHLADKLIDEGEDVVLKLHTKRSLHLPDGDTWRRDLVQQLLGPSQAQRISESFAQRPMLGMVGPAGHLLDTRQHSSCNQPAMAYIARRMGWDVRRPRPAQFFAGSMYWLRLKALRPLLDTHLHPEEFESESGQLDGTLAHALERLMADIVHVAGYQVGDSEDPGAAAGPAVRTAYRYAP